MKLADLGLKTKPATKYFDHGYIKFTTVNKELFFQIIIYDDKKNSFPLNTIQIVASSEHLKRLLGYKTRSEVLGLD